MQFIYILLLFGVTSSVKAEPFQLSTPKEGNRPLEKPSKTCKAIEKLLESAEQHKDGLRWKGLHHVYRQLEGCKSKAVKSKLSDKMIALVSGDIENLSSLEREFIDDQSFERFLLRQIANSTNYSDLKIIRDSFEKNCPFQQQSLCKDLPKILEKRMTELLST